MRNSCKLCLLGILLASLTLPQVVISAGASSTRDAKPAAVLFDSKCMAGQWHEQVDNPFRWIFEVRGDRLKI